MLNPDKKMMLEKMIMGEEQANASPMLKPSGNDSKDALLQAKLSALQDMLVSLQEELSGGVKNTMDSMKKVEVMAPDEASLKQGLEVAQEVVPEMDEMPKLEVENPEDGVDPVDGGGPVEDEEDDDEDGKYGLFGKRK